LSLDRHRHLVGIIVRHREQPVSGLSLFESGTFDINDITPEVGALDRPGATAEVGEAFRRG
jgi:hypothetical protein